jgi:hypothetical protein
MRDSARTKGMVMTVMAAQLTATKIKRLMRLFIGLLPSLFYLVLRCGPLTLLFRNEEEKVTAARSEELRTGISKDKVVLNRG